MARRFETSPPERALQIWLILISKASNRQTVRYGDLADVVGLPNPLATIDPLDHISLYCRRAGLPPLTVLVVNRDTGLPGTGWDRVNPGRDPNVERERVFNYDWFTIVPPTPEEFEAARMVWNA